ncbi:MAG: TPM domain-containing protein, partial [Tomitella sp.]|nr:TPM domain-containing protein [Tomitella sp.]
AHRLVEEHHLFAGVLGGDTADVQEAIDGLYQDHHVQLWVVYVDSFDGTGGEQWAQQTVAASGLGDDSALLAVATGDGEYGFVSGGPVQKLSDSDFASIRNDDIVPHLRDSDWSGAAIAAADGLGSALTGSGGTILIWVVVILVVVIGGALLWVQIRKRRRKRAEIAAARDADLTDPAVLSELSTDALDQRARELLVETDNALRTSADELELAVEEFGRNHTAPFRTAMQKAQQALSNAFGIRQRLDDAVPETPEQRRDMLTDLLLHTSRANAALDEQVTAFDKMRNLLITAPARLDSLTQRLVAATARIPASEQTFAHLQEKFDAAALASVSSNLDLAKQHTDFADENITAARKTLSRPSANQSATVTSIRAAESALDQTRKLLDAIDSAESGIRHALSELPDTLTDAQQGVDAAHRLAESGRIRISENRERLDKSRAQVEAALAEAEHSKESDPLGTYENVVEADADLDSVYAEVSDQVDEKERIRDLVDQTLSSAHARMNSAEDYLSTRRGGVGAEARTRLSEARRHLDEALRLRATDPKSAQREARAASSLAQQALHLAQQDVDRRQGPGGGGFGGYGGGRGYRRSSG